uniref:RRM Nup35-type domain-containing protein n=1 Tax=Spongospora subterranea TaxID=70186 RepID=A0A0H5QQY4_9EUKA|eukprot:CRZ03886.1 hypothetical protein [Spongospora subterranea]
MEGGFNSNDNGTAASYWSYTPSRSTPQPGMTSSPRRQSRLLSINSPKALSTVPHVQPANLGVPPSGQFDSMMDLSGYPSSLKGPSSSDFSFGSNSAPGRNPFENPNDDLPPLGHRDTIFFDHEPESHINEMEISALLSPIRPPASSAAVNTFNAPKTASKMPSSRVPVAMPRQTYSVLVFGFPPGSVASILDRFQGYGQVLSHSVGHGNWLRLQYTDRIGADQALQQDGRIINSSFMIGVKHADDIAMQPAMEVTRGGSTMTQRILPNRTKSARPPYDAVELEKPYPNDSICYKFISWITNW